MGTYNQGILGAFFGKVGNVVGSSWRGISYMRGYVKKVRNPRTPAQLKFRARLALVGQHLKALAPAIAKGFPDAQGMGTFGAATKANLPLAQYDDTTGQWSLDPAVVQLTSGNTPFDIQLPAGSAKATTVTWTKPPVTSPFYRNGQLVVAALNLDTKQAVVNFCALDAASFSFDFTDLPVDTGQKVQLYAFAVGDNVTSQTFSTAAGL